MDIPPNIRALDRNDPLADKRDEFELPDCAVYLNGNSLGVLPKRVTQRLATTVEQEWGQQAVSGWNSAGWYQLPHAVGEKIGTLIGARSGETIAADSTSVNIYKLLTAALRLRPGRSKIVTEQGNFPTDLYVAQGVAQAHGCTLVAVEPDAVAAQLDDETAVVLLSHVNYRDGAVFDMAEITRQAHQVGALVLWDLAHSAGAVPLQLAELDVDFAVGCGYKFLNGGPGAPAFAYVAEQHHAALENPIQGWFGHRDPFGFDAHYRKSDGINTLQVGTPPILSLAALDTALDVFADVDMQDIDEKRAQLYDTAWRLCDQHLAPHGFTVITPPPDQPQGSQISLQHSNAWPMVRALHAAGFVGDFRAPDVLRFGFTPLYTRFADVWQLIVTLQQIAETRSWDHPDFHAKKAVT